MIKINYKDKNNIEKFLIYRDKQISKLEMLIKEWTELENKYKQSVLLSYWLDDYESFLRNEDKFKKKKKYFTYKRGQVLFINFGYRIGHELSGNHYAVVITSTDSPFNGNITVVPLISKKNSTIRYNQVDLGNCIVESLSNKANTEKNSIAHKIENLTIFIDNTKPLFDKIDEILHSNQDDKIEYFNIILNEISPQIETYKEFFPSLKKIDFNTVSPISSLGLILKDELKYLILLIL
ncbi:type II toxin-antitoxin system PemK/MazF family toxin [Anaerosphaera multitolerans]|uniref:type II toxin-antitoxin system PemK/MazF family toxin n=1 Tax=Anaerosphaera multitolerans TaxID=2487351 RepID=UPI000FDC1E7F|nr:type II toxin-antitoxin system PemK/MazF family toxin [Anaerosphaera multitolerans]